METFIILLAISTAASFAFYGVMDFSGKIEPPKNKNCTYCGKPHTLVNCPYCGAKKQY